MRIKLLSIFALLCLAVTSAWADDSCGDGVTWSYAAGTLTISYSGSGTGAMTDYGYNSQPWNDKKGDITSIVIGSGVTHIGNHAFQSCNNPSLTSITIPAGVTSIGSGAFYRCTGLTSITIPASVTSIGSLAFNNCTGLTSINVDAANANYASEDGVLFNKTKTTIIQYSPGKSGTAYTIPASVTSIDRYAFSDCSNLASIEIPASVTSIGESAFRNCSGLTSVSFAPGTQLESIGDVAFYGCNNVNFKSIEIPASVTSIGTYAFANCTNLATVTVYSTNCTLGGNNVFNNCNNLAKIYVPNAELSTYQNTAYWSDKSALIFGILDNGTSGDVAWTYTSDGALTISGTGAMANYTSFDGQPWNGYKADITSIVIGSGVTHIGDNAFYQCKNQSLTSITIPASVTSIGRYAFWYCSKLTSIEIPASVTSIGNNAFGCCIGLTSVTFASGSQLTTIDANAFYDCDNVNFKSIEIPASVTSIGNWAFNYCRNLATVTLNSNPAIGTNAFDNIKSGATVTMNLTANAAGTDYWMTFYNDGYNFKADDNTTVYKGKLNGASLELTEVADRIVTKGNAVILKSTGNPVMTVSSTESTDGYAVGTNDLKGTMVDTPKPANCYTLANGTKGVGFYLYSGTNIHAGKAYLIYTAPSTAREFIGFGEDETSLTPSPSLEGEGSEYWYTLDGRRISGKPMKKGVYVRNGQKVVIK